MDSQNIVTMNMNNRQVTVRFTSLPVMVTTRYGRNVNDYRAINGAYAPMNYAHYWPACFRHIKWLNTRPIQQKLTMPCALRIELR